MYIDYSDERYDSITWDEVEAMADEVAKLDFGRTFKFENGKLVENPVDVWTDNIMAEGEGFKEITGMPDGWDGLTGYTIPRDSFIMADNEYIGGSMLREMMASEQTFCAVTVLAYPVDMCEFCDDERCNDTEKETCECELCDDMACVFGWGIIATD